MFLLETQDPAFAEPKTHLLVCYKASSISLSELFKAPYRVTAIFCIIRVELFFH